uniref:Methyltransferase-like protein 5 n=1 Tax=uncultured organism TaxID=155900 RepID=M1PV40_9ZZZZ|nr:methyltransferase [uncultured organism]
MGLKKKDLEIKLESIERHPDPKPELEQYTTLAPIASDIIFTAYTHHNVLGKKVADLGCGTGIFSIGAALAGAEEVLGYDIDEKSLEVAGKKAEEFSLSDRVEFLKRDVSDVDVKVDTVLMNPPFGAQKKGADIPFLDKAFEIADFIYTIHNAVTEHFLRRYIKQEGHELFWEKRYMFDIDNIFTFHEKEKEEFKVVSFGIKKRE